MKRQSVSQPLNVQFNAVVVADLEHKSIPFRKVSLVGQELLAPVKSLQEVAEQLMNCARIMSDFLLPGANDSPRTGQHLGCDVEVDGQKANIVAKVSVFLT